MTAFAKFTLSVLALFDTPEERHLALSQRKELCEKAEVDMRQWSPATLKTLVNALALMYKQTAPGHGIVPSATIQFPTFCKFFNAACKRDRNASARKEPVQVLQDSEVAELFDKTNWQSWYEAQRMNLLLLAFNLGQRPESLTCVLHDSVAFGFLVPGYRLQIGISVRVLQCRRPRQRTWKTHRTTPGFATPVFGRKRRLQRRFCQG